MDDLRSTLEAVASFGLCDYGVREEYTINTLFAVGDIIFFLFLLSPLFPISPTP